MIFEVRGVISPVDFFSQIMIMSLTILLQENPNFSTNKIHQLIVDLSYETGFIAKGVV